MNQQPIYENVRQTETIIYERQITNLDEDENENFVVEEDHIYYAHQTNIASIQEHQLCRQISTRSISDPTLNKHPYFSPIKPPRTYCHDERDEDLVRQIRIILSRIL